MNAVARGLALLLLGLLLLGFGLCGAVGTAVGLAHFFASDSGVSLFLVPGLLGLLIAFGAWKGIAAVLRTPGSGT